jgi:hypothetical protein
MTILIIPMESWIYWLRILRNFIKERALGIAGADGGLPIYLKNIHQLKPNTIRC